MGEQLPGLSRSHMSHKSKDKKYLFQRRCWLCCQVIILLIVWGILSIPIVLYYSPIKSEISVETDVNKTNKNDTSLCSQILQYDYTNQICGEELYEFLASSNCVEDVGEPVLIIRNEMSTASQLFAGLNFLGASEHCKAEVIPFLCVYLFGLCTSSGVSIQPSASQCERIRDSTCQREWSRALQFDSIVLPDCSMFPVETSFCENITTSFNNASGTNFQETINPINSSTFECSDGFYRENTSSICTPSCHTFSLFSKSVTILTDVLKALATFIGFVAAIVAIAISFLRYKQILTFPFVFIFYMVLDAAVLGFLVLISYCDRNNLHCSSINLVESLQVVSPFCIISGAIFTYILLQLGLWWFFHTVAFFWRVHFPFHARSYEGSSKVNYIHLICVLTGIIFPFLPIVTLMGKFAYDIERSTNNVTFLSGGAGFLNTRFPPIVCTGGNSDVVFYSLVLELNIIVVIGCTLLIIILWTVLRHNTKSKAHQSSKGFKLGAAEKKLIVVSCYYVIFVTTALTTFTISTKDNPRLIKAVEKYIFCEQGGRDPNNLCSMSEIEALTYPTLEMLSHVLLSLLPLSSLWFVINVNEMKAIVQKWYLRMKALYKSSTATTTQ